MINDPSSQGGTGTGASSSSSSGNTGTAGHVQFRMTVKLDIEGHVPTAATTSSATTVDATSAAAQSTQDLLLKLQPLLPHLCISKESATMLHRTRSAANVEQQLRQVQEHVEAPASTTCDESELELSLGLSMFKKPGTVNTTDTATDTSNINTVSCQPESSSLCWSSQGGGREAFQESIEGKNQQQGGFQREPSNVGGMVRTESMALDWRAMEEHRLKREAQYQRRQEARKKRRILIDEQKQQRKAAAAAARGACSSSVTSLIKQASRISMLGSDTNVTSGATDEQKQQQQHELEVAKDEKVTMDESPTRKGKLGACESRSCSKTRKRAKQQQQQQQDSSTVTSGSQVKTEPEEVPATPTACVIRPSPIHEPSQEWVQKFLEMQSMVAKTPNSDEHEQQQRGDFDEDSISQRKQLRRMASLPAAGMTRQGSLNLKRISSPPPVPSYRDTAMDSQCSSVCSSMPLATGLFSPPTTYSTLTVPNKGQVAQVVTTRSVDPAGAPSSALLRSVSLGTYRTSNEQLQQQQQQQRYIEVPSPVRSSSNNALLLRTLSEGAALRALARAESADEKFASWQASSRLVNRNNKSSAFKSPKKEQAVPEQQPSSVTSGNTGGDAVVKAGEEVELPMVSTRGTGPNGKLVNGVLLAYKKGDVRIACACHGQHMTAKEFVEHAGGVDVSNPEKCIVVSPSKRARLHSQAVQ